MKWVIFPEYRFSAGDKASVIQPVNEHTTAAAAFMTSSSTAAGCSVLREPLVTGAAMADIWQ